jgi:hypothetical protein
MVYDNFWGLEFNCPKCGKKMKEKRRNMELERRISGNFPYYCPDCGVIYNVTSKRNERIFIISASVFIAIIFLVGLLMQIH